MFFKKNKNKEVNTDAPKVVYKAIYKSLYDGNTKESIVSSPTTAFTSFLIKGEDIWEMYMLTHVIPLNESQPT